MKVEKYKQKITGIPKKLVYLDAPVKEDAY